MGNNSGIYKLKTVFYILKRSFYKGDGEIVNIIRHGIVSRNSRKKSTDLLLQVSCIVNFDNH